MGFAGTFSLLGSCPCPGSIIRCLPRGGDPRAKEWNDLPVLTEAVNLLGPSFSYRKAALEFIPEKKSYLLEH
jgi:hypothetical protein